MINQLTKIDDRMIKTDILNDIEYRTDYRMRDLQKYNIPHWVDLDLKFIRPLYYASEENVYKWGSLFYMNNLYTENNGINDNIQWDRKYWMNEILSENKNGNKKHCTPFLLFKELEDGSYELIDINKIAVEVGPNCRSYLYINDLNNEEFFEDVSKLKALLLPIETDYICSNMESKEDQKESKDEFNKRYNVPCANITISEDNKISFDSDTWYEKVKLIATDINIYKGTITETDRAIKLGSGISYGKKTYLDCLILINPDGHIDMSYLKDNSIKEMENNILYFDTDRFTNYNYYIFFFTESNKSINMIYDIPKKIIEHDSIEYVKNGNNFILLDRETFADIMTEDGAYDLSLKIKDLIDKYSLLFQTEIDPERYKELEYIYLHDDEGNIIYGDNGAPLLDPDQFDMDDFDIKDGIFPIDGESYTWYKSYIQFINYWFYRVVNYKKNLLLSFINDNYKMFENDIKYSSITYKASEIAGTELEEGIVTTNRTKWTLYDEDLDYDGWTDQLVFINGKLDLDANNHTWNKNMINKKYIIDTYGEDATVEVVSINYNSDKILDVIIENNPNLHEFISDRYYDPRNLNFYNILDDAKRTNIDNTPIYKISNMDNPTLTQPIPFKMIETDRFNHYSIRFNENWAEVYNDSAILENPKVALLKTTDNIIAYVCANGNIVSYDLIEIMKILYKDYNSSITLDKYLEENDIKRESKPYIDTTISNVKDCLSFLYTKYNDNLPAITFSYGDSINDSIHIGTENDGYFTIEDIRFGNITHMAKNLYTSKFALLNSDQKLFEISYNGTNNDFDIRRVIDLDIKELNPIESYNENSIINQYNGEVIYNNGKVYTLTSPLGLIEQGGLLYDSEGNLLYDQDGNLVYDLIEDTSNLRSILTVYNVLVDNESYTIEKEEDITLDAIFIGAKIIANDDNLYIIGGNSGHPEIDRICYKYNFNEKKLTSIDYPEWIGYTSMSLIMNEDKTKLIILGGLGNYSEDTANKIAILDLTTDTWEDPIETELIFVESTVINHNNDIYILGGFTNQNNLTIDFKNISNKVYKLDLDNNTFDYVCETIVPFIGAKAIRNTNGAYILAGNKYPEVSQYLYKFNPDTGNFAEYIEMPVDYDYNSLCEFNYCDTITSILFTGNTYNGYDNAKVLNIHHQQVDVLFADKYGDYNVVIDGYIYKYNDDIDTWIVSGNIQDLVKDNPITEIGLSGDIYVAKAGNNKIYTTPDLIHWYDYKFTNFYSDEITEENEISDIDLFTNKIDDVAVDEFYRNEGASIIVTKDGKLLVNPYCMNMSMYYGNLLLIASNNRFATTSYNIDNTTDYVELPEDFKYCLDSTHYVVFEDGKLLKSDCYKLVFPSMYTPVNGIYVYLNYSREESYTAKLSVVYLPFPMINTNSNTELKETSGMLEISEGSINPFGVNNKWNWIFSNGEKIPFNYIQNISNTLIYLPKVNNIDWNSHPDVYRTYGDDLVSSNIVNDDLDKFVNNLIKNVVTDWGNDINIDINEFIEKATFEERIILLKVYADHYVAGADYKGNTAPYILDYECDYYNVLNGNIEWRD